MPTTEKLAPADGGAPVTCWCCGSAFPPTEMVELGAHPEVAVCLDCARSLHLRARQREDERRPSVGTRARDIARSGREVVIHHGWHQRPVVGGALRWLGRHLP